MKMHLKWTHKYFWNENCDGIAINALAFFEKFNILKHLKDKFMFLKDKLKQQNILKYIYSY